MAAVLVRIAVYEVLAGASAAVVRVVGMGVLALLSGSAEDKLDRTDEETLEKIEDYQLFRTDQKGWIEVSTDGERLWVEVELLPVFSQGSQI